MFNDFLFRIRTRQTHSMISVTRKYKKQWHFKWFSIKEIYIHFVIFSYMLMIIVSFSMNALQFGWQYLHFVHIFIYIYIYLIYLMRFVSFSMVSLHFKWKYIYFVFDFICFDDYCYFFNEFLIFKMKIYTFWIFFK